MTINLSVELRELGAFVGIIRDRIRGTLEPLEAFADGVGVYNVEVVVQWLKSFRVVDGVSNEFPLNEGMLDGVGTVRVMVVGYAKFLDSSGPSIRIVVVRACGLRGWNI